MAMATMNSEADCVVSPSPATPPQPSQHNRFLNNGSETRHDDQETQTLISQRMQSGICFKCRKQGHWANQCPLKTPTKSPSSPSAPSSSFPIPLCDLPAVSCPHCQVICTVKVSRSVNNPGKKYYACPFANVDGHKFFKWFDHVIEDCDQIPRSSMYPRCGCDAGICRLMVDINEPHVGRYYFVCPIEKGHGACCFRRYMDDTQAIDTLNHGLREGGELGFEHSKKRKFESLTMDNLQHPSSFVSAITEPVEEAFIERVQNDSTSGMSTLQDMVPEEAVSLDHVIEKALQVSSLKSQAIHRRQAEFWRQISAAGDASIADPTNQFLGLQILGWLGRLAFPPSRCLTVVPPRPFFCCVFPSFDPIFVPKEAYVFDLECLSDQPNSPSNAESDSSPQIVSHNTQHSSGVSFELGLKNVCGIQQGFDVNGPMLEVLRQAASLFQCELLSRLDTMDPLDHKKMALAADHHFAPLNHLFADCTSFSERVRKFIACASSLAEIERSINADPSAQEIMERYEEEKHRYNNIYHSHAQTMDAVTASEQHIKSLRKEALHVKEMLLKIENQLTCCEAENKKLKSQVCEISENLLESEKKMNAACEEVEAAKKLGEEREVARSAAKAALEEARIQLRQ